VAASPVLIAGGGPVGIITALARPSHSPSHVETAENASGAPRGHRQRMRRRERRRRDRSDGISEIPAGNSESGKM
jgi:hypothetical protein